MRITLQIENVDHLDTGGQLSYSCDDRGFDIGRHEHLDWSLPDPQRVISGKHCEVRFEGDQFVLYDFSTNGTFLNGSQTRMDKAHVLRTGDRVMIGDYIIKVSLDGSASAIAPAAPQPSAPTWNAPQPQPAATGPAWPSAPTPSHQTPYPSDPGGGGPWASPVAGMDGRHAPPSSDPGIGTPADDVWSQQGHGWGSADPALYDPNAQPMEREQVRPAQADPLDHLAQQPHLYPDTASTAGPSLEQPAPNPPQPFPPVSTDQVAAAPEPLFQLPDMEEPPVQAETLEQPAASQQFEEPGSPFPEVGNWPEPEQSEVPVQPRPQSSPAPAPAPAPAPVDEIPIQAPEPAMPKQAEKTQAGVEIQEAVASTSPTASVEAAPAALEIDFLKAFAEGAGIAPDALKGRDPEEFAREIGAVLNGITGDLMGLLQARSQVKAMTRNVNRTLIMRSGNNALKFSPTPAMALQTMLSQSAEETGYLPIAKAMSASFKDIQKHHVWTYAAMQKAAARFEATLSPKALEAEGQVGKSTFGNQKAKFWEKLDERWTSLTKAYDDGLVGVFTQYFTESYEEMSSDDLDEVSGGKI